MLPEEELLLQTIQEYTTIIELYIPYFNTLRDTDKKRFIQRTWYFRRSKNFHFVDMAEQKEIPILISAAAVQLSFGLKKYRFTFFKNIYIMPDAYSYENAKELYIGHVSPKGIFISWKHFLQGYANASDNVNVAIHEMAHALQYDCFMDHAAVDMEFRADFQNLPPVYGPALAGMVVQHRSYLRPYAYTNIQEFWAVSVEAFFENPRALKDNMPGLYSVIGEILNQDPVAITRLDQSA